MPDLLDRLSLAGRLQLLAFDAELRRLPRPLIVALWAGVDALERGVPTRPAVATSAGPLSTAATAADG